MKTFVLLTVLGTVLLSIAGGVSYTSQQVLGNDGLKIQVDSKEIVNNANSSVSATGDSDDEPALFHFASQSSFVVIATSTKVKPISKSIKKPRRENELSDLSDLVGQVHFFKVEKQLCSQQSFSFSDSNIQIPLTEFQIFIPFTGSMQERYSEGHRYLLFLETIPEMDKLASIYELERDKIYYRAFDGKTISLFPSEGGMHGPPTKGLIDLSKSQDQELAQKIEVFCEALNAPDLESRLKNLKALTNSQDKEIKRNAIYALRAFPKNNLR